MSKPVTGSRTAELLLRMQRRLLLITVAALPVVYTPGLLNDPYDMPKVTLLIGVVCFAMSFRVAAGILGAPWSGLRNLLLPATTLGLAFVASWMVSDYRGWSLLGLYLRYGGLIPYLAVIVFGVLLADAFAARGRHLLYALLVGGSVVAAVGVFQMVFMGAWLASHSGTTYVISTLGHSNFLGGYLAMILPLALGLWAEGGRAARAGMVATILVTVCLIFTVSQGGWLAGIAGAAAFFGLLAGERRKWRRRLGIWIAAATGIASVGAVVLTMLVPHPTVRLPSAFVTAASRGLLWEGAFAMGIQEPLLGWGPNVYAIEGPLNQVLENALVLNFTKGDDPHSVPIAMFANIGLLGLAAWIFVFVWTRRRWREANPRSPMQFAAAAALVAYLVQSVATVDELTLRFVLWVLIAAIAASAGTEGSWRPALPSYRPVLAVVVLGAGLASAAAAFALLSLADHRIRQGGVAFGEQQVADGRAHFEAGLALRADNDYKRRYAAVLTQAAVERGLEGGPLIDEMRQTMAYLDDFPDAQTLAAYSNFLNRWSLFEPEASREALAIAERAQVLDPYNPLLAVQIADILLQLQRPEDAASELAPFERLLTEEYPEYSTAYGDLWATVAMVHAQLGEEDAARAALARVPSTGDCRHTIALELLKPRADQVQDPALGLICPPTLTRLLPSS
jgi:O-antigen ligase